MARPTPLFLASVNFPGARFVYVGKNDLWLANSHLQFGLSPLTPILRLPFSTQPAAQREETLFEPQGAQRRNYGIRSHDAQER